jgi:subfamily B ATP-binding cassette protein MsbA
MLDEPSERDDGSTAMARAKGDIRFDGVSLQYPGRPQPAIDNIHLHIPSGKTYAFVGPSGGGKTSLMSLLPRLYEPSAGCIYIDETPISSLSLRSLRQQLALVSQDVVLFNDTIRSNIAYGRADLSDAQVWDAVARANLSSFIDSLPDGLETIVGDRGVRLSGGQRQRIAIARAVIKDAPILILDEATSALDTLSERAVQASIEALRANRTTLIVAHRLSSVVSADCIVVLQEGRIVQQGTHDELLQSQGLYQSLYAQMAEEQ